MAKKKVNEEEFEQILLDEESKESPKFTREAYKESLKEFPKESPMVEKDNTIPDKKQRWLN